MRCFGEFKDDRTCDMCSQLDKGTYRDCISTKKSKDAIKKKKEWLREHCPNVEKKYTRADEGYGTYQGCNLKERSRRSYDDNCEPTEECIKKYYKKKETA
jgi:hypothetical protein